jgi:HD-like signal output (HDOD) protein
MAVLPSDHLLDFTALCTLLNRDLEPISREQLADILEDCEPGTCPPIGAAYGLDEIVDAHLLEQPEVYFEPGVHTELVRLSGDAFRHLKQDCHAGYFSKPMEELRQPVTDTVVGSTGMLRKTIEQYTPARIKRNIEEFHDLPAMPSTAQAVLKLYTDPNADANALAGIVELDPGLAAKVIRYAASPLYGYQGNLTSIKDAISRVLGFDMVMNLAMGLAIGKSFRIPPDGPLGLNAYWQHSVYCAALCERLARAIPREMRPRLGTAYLAGLLHNLGRLLLGHVFQSEHFLLNRFILANPELPVADVERFVLGVGHEQIGGWLMQAWNMPAELIAAVHHHHDEDYWDQHAIYPQLVLLANRLLKRHGLGDAETDELPRSLMQMLDLSEAQVTAVTDHIMKGSVGLDSLAQQLVA